jgi:hypothetical protein
VAHWLVVTDPVLRHWAETKNTEQPLPDWLISVYPAEQVASEKVHGVAQVQEACCTTHEPQADGQG